MTVTPLRPHTRAAAEAVNFAALTECELRAIFYLARLYLNGYDHTAPDQGMGRMMRTITAVLGDVDLGLIGEVGELMTHAVLTRNDQLQRQLFPDTNRWDRTYSAARVFRATLAQDPSFLTVHTVTQRWHTALNSRTHTAKAVA